MTITRKPLLGVAVGALSSLLVASGAFAVPTVFDTFTDGGRSNGADALDTNWFTSTAATTATVGADATLGTGNALIVDNTTNGAGVIAGFSPIELSKDREKIVLTFNFRATSFGNPQDSAFRYGILNDGGTPRTGDTTGNIDDDRAYFVLNDTGAAAGSEQIRRDPGTSGLLGGADAFIGGTDLGGGARPGIGDTNARHAALTVQRTTDTRVDLRSRIGTVVNNGLDSAGLLTSTFNQIALTTGGGTVTDYVLDNVTVERRINVFDDTFASSGATVGNDANDPNDTAWSSLSGSATLSIVNDAGIGSGNAMSVVTSGDFRNVATSFADVTLQVGERLIASFDARLTQFANIGGGFRFGLYDDLSTATANEGYFVNVATGTTAGLDFTKDTATSGGLFGGPSNIGLGSTAFNLDETLAHYFEWIVTRTGIDTILHELYIDGVLVHTAIDGSNSFDRFGAFGFLNGGSGASTDFIVDNLVIDYANNATVPEPATALLALAGLGAMATRRRRMA